MQPERQNSLRPSRPARSRHAASDFARARQSAERTEIHHQREAAKRVAERSRDAGDCRELLSMLGLASLPASSGTLPEGARG